MARNAVVDGDLLLLMARYAALYFGRRGSPSTTAFRTSKDPESRAGARSYIALALGKLLYIIAGTVNLYRTC